MDFSYVAYTKDKKLVKGKLSASSGEAAVKLLDYGGYHVLSIRPQVPFLNMERLSGLFAQVNPREIIMFSRQLALLLESGTDIVAALELLQSQVTNRTLQRTIGNVASDIRSGSSLSTALKKHPKVFSSIYARAMTAGEQSGNLEIVLRQMANFIERRVTAEKSVKNALTYPFIIVIVAVIVVGVIVTFVLPTFTSMYTQFSVEQPLPTRMLLGLTDLLTKYGLYLILVMVAAAVLASLYVKTPAGKYMRDKILFRLPVVGRILLLSELSQACRTMALLFKVGLPLPEVLSLTTESSNNRAMAEQIDGVRQELILGEGLSRPMSKRSLFLPLMVQMVGVGEETGNLDNTLTTVAESYEMEADDRTTAAVRLIQPIVTVLIALVVGFVALSMISAMYSIYGELG